MTDASDFKRCDVCTKPIAPGKLLCLRHWRLVPLGQQRAVNKTWRAFNAAQGAARLPLLRDYRTARDAAVAAVRALITPTQPATAGETNDQAA